VAVVAVMLAYDSPVWFYVFMVPVFTVLGVALGIMAYALWKEVRRDA
jgi:hypothetical protein